VAQVVRHRPYGMRRAVPWLRWLDTILLPRLTGFDPGSVHVRFMAEKTALGQVVRILGLSPVSTILTVPHAHITGRTH